MQLQSIDPGSHALEFVAACCIRGTNASAYIAMAKGQPCVVPSCERNWKQLLSSDIKMRVGTLYALISTNFITGQMYWTFQRATARLTLLNALSASISRIPSLSSLDKNSRIAFAASTPAGCPAHSCSAPTAVCRFPNNATQDLADSHGPQTRTFVDCNASIC